MALTEQEKRDLFNRIRLDTIKGIFDDHQKLPYRLWGWVRNNVRRLTGASNVTKAATAGNLALSGISMAVKEIPMLGTVVTTVGGAVIAAMQGKELYKRACASDDPEDKVSSPGNTWWSLALRPSRTRCAR
jgi:hypothetical protein